MKTIFKTQKLLFYILFSILNISLSAQHKSVGGMTIFQDGYVVTMKGDSIKGRVKCTALVGNAPKGVKVDVAGGDQFEAKADEIKAMGQNLPKILQKKNRSMVEFDRIENPKLDDKPMLLERLTEPAKMMLYYDATGWKRQKGVMLGGGSTSISLGDVDLSYIIKKGNETWLVKKGDIDEKFTTLFGDCSAVITQFEKKKDWSKIGEMVVVYNQNCGK